MFTQQSRTQANLEQFFVEVVLFISNLDASIKLLLTIEYSYLKQSVMKKPLLLLMYLLCYSFFLSAQKHFPFEIKLNPLLQSNNKERIMVKIEIIPYFSCDTAMINIQKFGNIDIYSTVPNKVFVSKNSSLNYNIEIKIPENDTVGFEIKVSSGKIWHHAFLFFVTKNGEMKTYPGNPKFNHSPPPTKSFISFKNTRPENDTCIDLNPFPSIQSKEVDIIKLDSNRSTKDIYQVDSRTKSTLQQKKIVR